MARTGGRDSVARPLVEAKAEGPLPARARALPVSASKPRREARERDI